MKFFNRVCPSLFKHQASQLQFQGIQGYDDIKDIVRRALDSDQSFNLLLIGAPASSKTMFLMEIMKAYREAEYFDGTNTTSRILDVLEEKRSKIILLDEDEKMGRPFQNQLLNFLESGHIKVTQMRRNYDFEIKGCKVFATANDASKLSKPLASRFKKLFFPRYTEEQFLTVSEKVLPFLSTGLARYIGNAVWMQQGDIRDVISIGKLVRKNDGPEQIQMIMSTMAKYAVPTDNGENR
ncbi:MAG: ATP-binding protein [Candidatus Nitrosopolaris sp.]